MREEFSLFQSFPFCLFFFAHANLETVSSGKFSDEFVGSGDRARQWVRFHFLEKISENPSDLQEDRTHPRQRNASVGNGARVNGKPGPWGSESKGMSFLGVLGDLFDGRSAAFPTSGESGTHLQDFADTEGHLHISV